jgi:predicted dehydrogenase
MAMSEYHRRSFFRRAGLGAAAAAAWPTESRARAAEVNDKIVVGTIGCGGQGSALARNFAGRTDNVVMAYTCDPDRLRAEKAAAEVESRTGSRPKVVQDLRKVLDDKRVDAVVVATPDHWHAPAGIMACDAGKHVYVEKPCAHNVREGRLLVEAARRNQVVVQHGTQSRSNSFIAGGIQMLREGIVGDVLVAKAWNIQRRRNIGHAQPGDPPPHVDYDLWVGPAEWEPFQENRFHYNWHWTYNFGCGGSGGDGPHEIDYARWGLGVETHPSQAAALGGIYYFDDDRDHCDTQMAVFEYPGDGSVGSRRQFIYEQRLWSTSYPYNVDAGAEFYGTEGRMFLSKRGKLQVYDERNRRIDNPQPKEPPQLVDSHIGDFLDAIRTERRPQADIEVGHLSVTLGNLANIATRVQRTLHFDPETEQLIGDGEAAALLSRPYRQGGHWAIPEGVS